MVHSSRPRRHFIKRKRGDAHLEERDPSLINLPFPLPSIPVISNLLDPLISGEKPQSSSSAQAPTPTASTVPSSPDNSGSSGDNSASSSGSGDNGSSSSDNDTGSESGSSSSSESGSGSKGSSPSPTVSSAASTPTVATGKGSSFVDTSDAKPTSSGVVPSPSVASTSVAAVPSASAVTEATGSNSSAVGSVTSTAGNAPSSPIANVAAAVNDGTSSSAVQASGVSSSHSTQPTVIGSLGTGIGSSSSSDTNSSTGSATDNNASSLNATSHSSLSGGAIAGIILAALVAGGFLIVFVMRRRAQNKRKARQTAWFFGRNARNTSNINADPTARISTRSSWGTPYDGRALYTDAMSPTPDSAPNNMAQLNSAPLTAPPVVVTQKQETRASMYSIGSASSEGSGEGLPLPAPVYGEEMPSTPMSARAFSPMNGHSFPKPPSTTSSHAKEEKRKSVDELIDLNNPFEDRLPPGASPFADPIVPVTPGARTSVGSSVGSAGSVIGIGTRVTIARPFTPSLHDEIGVRSGDEVVVLQAFDDGWVQIRNTNKDVGLIPLDCFRAEGQDTATFLASKRVSSFFQAGFLQ